MMADPSPAKKPKREDSSVSDENMVDKGLDTRKSETERTQTQSPTEERFDASKTPTKLLIKMAIKGTLDWKTVIHVLQSRTLLKKERYWIVNEVVDCLHFDSRISQQLIHILVTDDMMNYLLTNFTKLEMWSSAIELVRHRHSAIDEHVYMWAFNEIVSRAKDEDVERLLFDQFERLQSRNIEINEELVQDIQLCLSKIPVFLSRGMWGVLVRLLNIIGVRFQFVSESVQKQIEYAQKQIVDAAIKHDFVHPVVQDKILPEYVADSQLESVLVAAVEHNCWMLVSKVLSRMVRFDLHLWAVKTAAEKCELGTLSGDLLGHCSWSIYEKHLLQNLKPPTVSCIYVAHVLTTLGAPFEYFYKLFLERQPTEIMELTRILNIDYTAPVFSRAVEECQKAVVQAILQCEPFRYTWDSALCEALIAMTNYKDLNCAQTTSIESDLSVQRAVFDDILSTVTSEPCRRYKCLNGVIEYIRKKIADWNKQLNELSTNNCLFSSTFLEIVYKKNTQQRCHLYNQTERNTSQEPGTVIFYSDRPLLYVLGCVPILVDLQNEALKIVVREGRWEVIRHANLFYIWEPVRRVLFREAVEQEQWALVSQLADHALYDDQRLFAVEEAYIHKQWDVMLKLSDFGLTEAERMHVYRRLLLHADMQTIRKIVEREDIGRLVELCGSRGRKMQAEDFVKLAQMKSQLVHLQRKFASSSDTLETVLRKKHWGLALFRLKRKRSHSWSVDVLPVIKAAMRANAIHVTKALLTLETVSQAWRDSLLPVMVKRRQWAACRALLEGGVSAALRQQVLPQLMEARQWLLLARLLEFELSTQSRENIFNFALDNREGTVVTTYLETMQTPLTMDLRQDVFSRSLEFGVWQALRPLVQFTDDEGLKVRDRAMELAIENKQWDIVDCCLLRGADLDSHKDEEGLTFVQIRAKEHEWTDVEKLVERGAAHDMYYVSSSNTSAPTYPILHRAIEACRWKTVKLLIQFYGDLNRPNPYTSETPLQMLTDLNSADLIEETLFWGCDVTKGVTKRGRTTLHAVCEAGRWETMYYLIARGVDPLKVTENGQSVLMFAVLNQDRPDRMVAECIRLGLSTCQPYITETQYELLDETIKNMASSSRNNTVQVRALSQQIGGQMFGRRTENQQIHFTTSKSFSPFQRAVFRNLPRVQNMLYESGACSYRELWRYYTDLEKCSEVSFCHDIERDLPNLRTLASTPRTLQSSCRLVISHQISECCKRRCYQRNVQSLFPFLTGYYTGYRCTGSGGKWIEMKKWNEEKFIKYLQFDDLTRLCVKEQPD